MKTKSFEAQRHSAHLITAVEDSLAVEAVLHVKVNGVAYTTTVRTPGEDEYLVRGLLHTEGVLTALKTPLSYREIKDPETGFTGCLEVSAPVHALAKDIGNRRSAMVSASCGLCGIREPEELRLPEAPVPTMLRTTFDMRRLPGMLQTMEQRQQAFQRSGGCHAAAAFTITGDLLAIFEDIGRHNAVDKVIGCLISEKRLDSAACLLVSGRISYEIVFKAYRAGLPILMAVSAPSSLAVETAAQAGMTVIGFCREKRATVYSNPWRVAAQRDSATG